MQIFLLAYLGIGILNLCYFLGFFKALAPHKTTSLETDLPVSVIICAKNEAENLQEFLPSILAQEHSDFEVILINDASTDSTLEVMGAFQRQDERVQLVNVVNNEAFWANKKYALTLGIKKAQNPYLLFTDADCQPQSPNWISEMSSKFDNNKSIVLGYGGYFKKKNSLLNKLIRFETFLGALQYFSYANWGLPYMGVGRNLAYTAEEFFDQNGFASHLHLCSGDDDLFVNEAATAKNTAVANKSTASTRSIPKNSFKDWLIQKRRHVSVSGHYKPKHQVLLGFFYFTQFSFWILFLVLIFGSFWKITVAFLAFRLLVQGVLFFKAGKKWNELDLYWLFPFLEILLICSQLGIFISNLITKPTHWK